MAGVKAAFDKVDKPIAKATRGQLKPVVGAQALARGQKGDLDQVDEATAEDLDPRTIGAAPDQRPTFSLKQRAIFLRELVAVRASQGHVEHSVGAEGDSVEATIVLVAEARQ